MKEKIQQILGTILPTLIFILLIPVSLVVALFLLIHKAIRKVFPK